MCRMWFWSTVYGGLHGDATTRLGRVGAGGGNAARTTRTLAGAAADAAALGSVTSAVATARSNVMPSGGAPVGASGGPGVGDGAAAAAGVGMGGGCAAVTGRASSTCSPTENDGVKRPRRDKAVAPKA